ncbi:MAG: hypothetical protein L0219_04790 [Phycisphaerales bacterium]|nr:hypothetical protein [Phycisphaerales bacterium]
MKSILTFVACIALCCCCGAALAQQTATDYIEPRISRAQYSAFITRLHLRKDQRTIADIAFEDYSATLTDLARTFDDRANAAGRKTVQDALSGKARIKPEELRRLRADVLNVYRQVWPVADQALQDLAHSVEALLTTEQSDAFDRALRQLHREILLHPRQADGHSQEYAGDGVDVLQLVESARAEGGELAAVDPEPLQLILDAYEFQLDAFLVQSAPEHRLGRFMRDLAAIQQDAAARAQQEQAAIDRWKQLYQLNSTTVQQIGELAAASVEESHVERWYERFDRASFTWLYPRRKPDRQIEWIRQQPLGDERLQQANSIYDRYLARRKALSRRSIDLMIRGRTELQVILYSMMDPATISNDNRTRRELYEELVKNTGEQATLDSETSSALESLLSDSQRQSLRDAMKKPDSAARRR